MNKYIFLLTGVFNLIFNTASYSQWKQVKSLTGGATSSMAADGNTIYAVVNFFGLVKSTDNGNHWHFVNDSIPLSNYNSRAVSAEGSKISVMPGLYGNNFNYSSDSGNTWQYLSIPEITGGSCYDIKIYKGKIIATGAYYVYISGDDGISWTIDSLGPSYYHVEISDDKLFLVPDGGAPLYTTQDTCNTWVSLGFPNCGGYNSFSAQGDTIAIVTPYRLQVSTDFGASWNIILSSSSIYYVYPLVFLDNGTLYLINKDSIFNSYDLGATWNYLSYHQGLNASSIVKTGNNFLTGSWNHAFVRFKPSDNSTQKMARGIFATEVYEIKTKGDTILVKGKSLVYYSYNNGGSWNYSLPNKYPASTIGALEIDTGAVYVASQGSIFRSVDWGMTWSVYGTISSTYPATQILYNNGELYYATWDGIFKGDNQGGPITQYGNMFRHFSGLAICKNKLFAVCRGDVYVTNLTPVPHWKFMNTGLNQANGLYSLAANDSAVFITGYNRSVYRCYPPDTIWQGIGLYGKYGSDLICYNNSVFTTKAGIEILPNSHTNSWIPFNYGLQGRLPEQIALNDSFMFCGGRSWHTFGLFRSSVSDLPFPLGIDETAYENELYFSVYPNPVSDNLQINGYIQSSTAEINLMDITGRNCFHKKIFSKGDFMINIIVNNFSEGIYILHLTDGSRKYSEKILIKK